MKPALKPQHLFIAGAIACAGLASAAQAASIQIFKQPNFTGAELTVREANTNLKGASFHDQASSLVLDGAWELCTQPNFQGDCKVLQPGRYATLDQSLNHRIESVRPVPASVAASVEKRDVASADSQTRYRRDEITGGESDYRYRRGELADRGASHERRTDGAIELFPGPDFNGRPLRLERDAETLEGQSSKASSLVIHEGTWQLCTQAFYEGYCRTFEPGQYASLGRLDNRVASAKLMR